MTRIGVLASGRGSNFQSIADAVADGRIDGRIVVLISDKRSAKALDRARNLGVEAVVVEPAGYDGREAFDRAVVGELEARQVDLVVLAGFMRMLSPVLVRAFPNRIMNIHPALLPSFPGLRGQGDAVDYGVKIAGCTVHFVDEGMDTGPIIIQAAVPALFEDTEESLAARILRREHEIYPEAVRLFCAGRLTVEGRRVRVDGSRPGEDALLLSHADSP